MGADYAQMLADNAAFVNQPPIFTVDQAAFGRGTDWQDEITRTALVTNHNLSFSGVLKRPLMIGVITPAMKV